MTKEKVTEQTADTLTLNPPDVFPDFAISLEEANRRVKMLQEFVRDHMVEGEDYGVIPGTQAKPTLFKPGAEKLNAIFGLAPLVEITNRVEDWDESFVAYEVKVTLLNKRSSQVEAEGIGSCNSHERRYKSQDAANIANTVLKMSKKRALIDATLSATRASGLFTQDLEDMESDRPERDAHERHTASAAVSGRGERAKQSGGTEAATLRFTPAHEHSRPAGNGNTLTDAQRGAILSMANKAFGPLAQEELARFVDKPIAQLSKSEASALLDRLRSLLIEQQLPRDSKGFTSSGQREAVTTR
ncbi:MAG: hypothetical protein JO316_19020 [Abitibacteriaceae bacterium]|nr:hypothetical protein [Abditibacteriaceae bacterium]MBV9867450.1 hypothetical protein [Abditibacteriaceae bacterium]